MNVGDVVVMNFPYSDLSDAKRRPAVVLARSGVDDFIACQMTTSAADPDAVRINTTDARRGRLRAGGFARPGKLFTADRTLITRTIDQLKPAVIKQLKRASANAILDG